MSENRADPAETAMLFINTPYRYGGRLAWGIDCSGLVQLALLRNGVPCPRDSGQQQNSAGTETDLNKPERGDLVFFPGHAGIMANENDVINASSRTMSVAVEPLQQLLKIYGDISAVRRIL